MASKDKVDLGKDDLDDIDFGDLDFNDPFAPNDNSRSPVENFKTSTLNTVKDRMLDQGLLRRLVAMALPKGYSQAFNAYDALDSAASDVLKDNAAELQPYMRNMNRKLALMSPAVRRMLPKSVRDSLEDAENQSSGSYGSGPDELSVNLAGIDNLLSNQAQDKIRDEFRDAVKDTRENKRFASEMEALTTIGRGIGRMVGFQDSFSASYMRKSLELKYRHLDVSVRTLKAQQEFHSLSKSYLDGIQKNTALPDFVKMRSTEVLKQQLTNRLAASAMQSAGNFTAKYFNNVKQNASEMVGAAVNLHQELGQGADFGQTRAQMFGTMLGGVGGSFISNGLELLGGTLADKAAPYIEKVPGVQAGGNFLRRNLTGIPQRLNEYAKSDTTREGVLGLLEEGIKAVLDRHSPTSIISGSKLDALDKPAVFDNMFHRAVTDVIPSFLASMDRSLKVMVTGEDQEEMAYSYYSNSLVSRSELNKTHVRLALKDNNGQGIRTEVDALLREMNANDLSIEAKRALRRQLLKDMTSANDFKPARYIKVETWNTVPEEIAEELIDFFADTFGLDPAGNVTDRSQKTADLTQDVRQKFIELTDRLPDYGGRMDVLQNVVGRRAWRELGLAKYNGDYSDVINMDALNDLIVNEGEEQDLSKAADGAMPKFTGTVAEKLKQRAEWERARLAKNRNMDPNRDLSSSAAADSSSTPLKFRGQPPRAATPGSQMQVDANVVFPELMKTSDEETHQRLDAMLDLAQQSNQWLEYILEASLQDGGPDGGDIGGGPSGSPASPARRKFSALGLAGKVIGGTARGLGNYFKFTYGLIGKGLGLGARGALGAGKLAFTGIDGLGVTDVFVRGSDQPALTAKGIRRGLYIDVLTKKVITKLKDITGPVINEKNETVLTQEEFDEGLYNGQGQSLVGYVSRKALGAAGMLGRGLGSYFGATYGGMYNVGKWALSKVVDQFAQFDAYLPGDEEPRIRSVLMKKGYYRDASGNRIMSLKDIVGPVFEFSPGDKEPREIVSQAEIDKFKSFYTKSGSLLFTVGRAGMNLATGVGKLAGKAAMAYGRMTLGFYKGLWKGAKAIGRGVTGLGKGMFGGGSSSGVGMLDDEAAMMSIELQGQQLQVQRSILDFMRSKWDQEGVHGDTNGDGERDWSWADQLKRRKAAAEGKAAVPDGDNADVVEAINQLGERLDDNFEHLADVTEEAGETSLLQDAADLSELGDGNGRRRGRGKPKGPKGKAGWMRRGLGSIGRGLGRIRGVGMVGRGIAAAGTMASAALPALGTAAAWTGGALLTGASAIGSAALTAGTAVVSTLGLPLILGVAAVAGIAYLGYKYYKSEQAKDYPLLYLRMTQYGVAPTDKARVEQLIQLEATVKNGVRIGKDGTASISTESIDAEALLKIFSISDPAQQNNLYKWMATRFRPVFLAHCTAMQRIRGTTDLVSADQGIGDGDLDTFLNIADLGGMQDVYNDLDTSPFDSDLDTDAGDVVDAVKMVRNRRKSKVEEAAKAAAVGVTLGSKDVVEKNTTLGVSASGSSKPDDISRGLMLATAGAAGGLGAKYQSTSPAVSGNAALDIPTAVRYKAYGLKELNLAKCRQLQSAEDVYWGVIQYSGTDKAMMGGDSALLEQKVADIFKPADESARTDMIRWLNYRFIPVLLQYAISVRRRYNGDARDASRNLTGTLMHEVLDEVSRAQSDTMFSSVSVWTILNSPWAGYELETMPGSIQLYLDSLDKGDKNQVMNVAGLAVQKRTEGAAASYGETLTNTALGNQRASTASPGVGQSGPTLANYGKIYGQGAVAGGAPGQTKSGVGDGSLLMSGPVGTQVQHPGGGTGGDINSLPNASGKGWQSMGPLIQAAAKMVGFDPVIAANVAGIESRWDPNASSGIAHGLFQFIGGTWKSMINKYGATYGIAPGTSPKDPRANAILGACYLKENYEGLSKTLGGKVSDLDLYMAHFLGLGGAKRFLSAPRNEPAYAHVGNGQSTGNDVVNNNGSVFISNGRHRTVGEVLNEMDRRMNAVRKIAGSPLSATAATVPESNVPGGPTPTEVPAANGGAAGGLATPEPSSVSADDVGVPTAVAAPATPAAAAAAAANGGSSGTPSGAATPFTPTGSLTPSTGSEIPSSTSVPMAPAPQPSPSRNMAAVAQETTVANQAVISETIAPLMQKQLEQLVSIDTTLKTMLQNQGTLGATPVPSPRTAGSQEPLTRTPINPKRENAVT